MIRFLFCLLASIFFAIHANGYSYEITNFKYKFDEDTKTATVLNAIFYDLDYEYSAIIPETVEYGDATYTVTAIGDRAFCFTHINSIQIPSSVIVIGRSAFEGSYTLEKITIPESVTIIGDDAFRTCKVLKEISLGSKIDSIGRGAFFNCNALTRVLISDMDAWCKISFGDSHSNPLQYAHHLYLNGEEVTNVIMPNVLDYVGDYIFQGASEITDIILPDNPKYIGDYAFAGCSKLKKIEIPSSVVSIGKGACSNCDALKEVIIPNTVLDLGSHAFESCRYIETLSIGDGITSIAPYAFHDCTRIRNLSMGNSIEYVEDHGFSACTRITEVVLPASVTTVGPSAFSQCKRIEKLILNPGLKNIGVGAFAGVDSLKQVVIPKSVTKIDHAAFLACLKLSNLIFEDGDETLTFGNASNPFKNNIRLTNIYLGRNISFIKFSDSPFSQLEKLKTLEIGPTVTCIPAKCFYKCPALETVKFNMRQASVEAGAFTDCNSLSKVEAPDLETWCNISFEDVDANPLTTAQHLYIDSKEVTEITLPENIKSIGSFSFYGFKDLTSLTINADLNLIGNSAFQRCTELNKIIFNNSGTLEMGNLAFADCHRIGEIICNSSIPPTSTNYHIFTGTTYENAKLYVPFIYLNQYKSEIPWDKFMNIITTKIYGISDLDAEIFTVFSLNGIKLIDEGDKTYLETLPKGIYIVNGKKTMLN